MIEPRYSNLNELFASRVFRIPKYQRFYSWEQKQRKDLLDDIDALQERGDEEHHFMATIVCFRTKERKPIGVKIYDLYDVVDGQQRLTTIIILLKCIHLLLEEGSDEWRDIADTLVKKDGHLVLLQTNNANERLFHAFIKDGRSPEDEGLKTAADRRLRDAIKECRDFVAAWKETHGTVLSLLNLILYRLGFVVYDTEKGSLVYTIFEVLNSRGLAVDWLDKCKSVLMGKAFELAGSSEAADAQIGRLNDIWTDIYQELAKENLSGSEVLRFAATLHLSESNVSRLLSDDASLEKIRGYCSRADATVQVSEWLLDVTKKLVKLRGEVFYDAVAYITQARLLAVAIMTTDKLSKDERTKALDQWERVTFRIFGLFDKDSRTKVGEYTRLAIAVMKGEDGASSSEELMESLAELGFDHSPIHAVKEALRPHDFYQKRQDACRYLLWRYEEHLAENAGPHATVSDEAKLALWKNNAADTIEHVYPQIPDPGGPWHRKMREGDRGRARPVEQHVHRLGNLVLLRPPLNVLAGNKGFAEKKTIYKQEQLRMLSEEIRKCSDWTLKEIKEREERIAKWAVERWSDLEQ